MNIKNKRILFYLILLALCPAKEMLAQYAPPAGQPGSTAMRYDSSAFVAWASHCSIERGFMDISNPSGGYASVGDSSMATGMAGPGGVVSLGDKGTATLEFDHPLVNGPSWDFAVFENSFDDYFLELAYVEVSSDGVLFYPFPSHSLTDTSLQVSSFDSLDATKINNLAGKYRGMYGTPFDLDEMTGLAGLDVNHITHIRIRDVGGCIQEAYAAYDTAGRKINDPWPTPFASGGFDLDGIGVIWNSTNHLSEGAQHNYLKVWPNPAIDHVNVDAPELAGEEVILGVYDITGRCLMEYRFSNWSGPVGLNLPDADRGILIIQARSENWCINEKFMLR